MTGTNIVKKILKQKIIKTSIKVSETEYTYSATKTNQLTWETKQTPKQ